MARALLIASFGTLVLAGANAVAAPDDLERTGAALRGLAALGLESPDGRPLFPADLAIASAREHADRLEIRLSGSFRDDDGVSEVADELRLETLVGALSARAVDRGVELWLPARGGWRRLGGDAYPKPPSAPLPRRALLPVPAFTDRLPLGGALLGRRIAISAGHGWLENSSGGFSTQRSRWDFAGCARCRGIVEDFFSAQFVTNQLVPLLQGMGAEVILVREPDHALEPASLIDNGDPGYAETGVFENENQGGWGTGARTSAAAGAVATWRPALAKAGARRVAVRFPARADRTENAILEIPHAGGTARFDLDQTRFGSFWFDLGTFWFPVDPGPITLSNGATGTLVADAVKVGGGLWHVSGKPWWQMGAASYVPWAGAPSSVTQYGDVSIRPAYAEFTQPDAYVSIHANASGIAGGSGASGTSTYRYSCQQYGDHSRSADATGCDDPPGSRALLGLVHAAMLGQLRASWDANWRDGGGRVANFGELRTLDSTPGILVETGFFDNITAPNGTPPPKYPDNRSLHDPRWREALARGIAEGLAAFLSPSSALPPLRPEGLVARNRRDGTLALSWRAAATATAYRVSLIDDARPGRDRAWNGGRIVPGTSLVLDDLVPGRPYAFRVAAVNAAGEGLASQAVVARFRGARLAASVAPAEVLVLWAYDRRDAWVQDVDNDLATAVEHGEALAGVTKTDIFFDGALDEAVEDGTVPLGDYRVVDFAAGKDSSEHDSVSRPMQALLSAHHAAGGALLVSGEELAYQLVGRARDAADRAFVEETLSASYVADDAAAFELRGTAGGPFAGLTVGLDDGTGGVYAVTYPDVLAPQPGATTAMTYPDGRGAAIARERLLYFGTGLETVVPAAARIELFSRAIGSLAPGIAKGDLDLDGASDACEQAHDLDWRDDADGLLDADEDGVSNAAECRDGTNPRDPILDAGTPDAGFDASFDFENVSEVGGFVDELAGSADDADDSCCGGCASAGPASLAWMPIVLALRRRRARPARP